MIETEMPDRKGWMTNAAKKDREHARQVVALRVLTNRVKQYVDSQVKILNIDPEIVDIAIHYLMPENPSIKSKICPIPGYHEPHPTDPACPGRIDPEKIEQIL